MRTVRYDLLLLATVAIIFLPGFQCILQNTQKVELLVTDAVSGQRVSGAVVTIVPSETLPGFLGCGEVTDDAECLDIYARPLGRSQAWGVPYYGKYVATADTEGEVQLIVDSITYVTGIFGFLATPVDQVTGTSLLVRAETDAASEILTLDLAREQTISGEFFEITLLSIGEPIPVDVSTESE